MNVINFQGWSCEGIKIGYKDLNVYMFLFNKPINHRLYNIIYCYTCTIQRWKFN